MAGASPKERQFELSVKEADYRTLRLKIAGGLLLILVSIAPLWVLRLMVEDLAGETTRVEVSVLVTISIALALTLAGVDGVLIWKLRNQRAELVRLRSEKSVLEARLLERENKEAPT